MGQSCLVRGQDDNVTYAKIRAYNIYGFTKYISWPNQALLKQFKIGILGNDSLLLKELKELAKTKTVEGLEITVSNFDKLSNIGRPQILYVNKSSDFDIDQVVNKVNGNNTLLISEKFPFHTSMINFVQVGFEQKFELNKELMINEGFMVDSALLGQAITSAEEWQELYVDQGKVLKEEKEKVEQQKEEITDLQATQTKLNDQIMKDRQRILRQRGNIKAQKKVLKNLLSESKDQDSKLKTKIDQLNIKELELKAQENSINLQDSLIQIQKNEISGQETVLMTQSGKIDNQKNILTNQLSRIKLQRILLYLSVALSTIITVLGFIAFRNFEAKKKANIVLKNQKEAIEKQKSEIEKKNTSIMHSISYAQRIQHAILPSKALAKSLFSKSFIVNLPKDIVSGDFFWAYRSGNQLLVAVADCTGHGVPGAFMSIIGNSLLKEIANQKHFHPNLILDKLKTGVIDALNQKEKGSIAKDGMDIALCRIDFEKNKLEFSGANNPVYILRQSEIIELKGDPQSIGYSVHHDEPFSLSEIDLQKGDKFYLFSDGFVDQKGGDKKKKYYYKNFKKLLIESSAMSMTEQGSFLEKEFTSWRGDFPQIDDVFVLGFMV